MTINSLKELMMRIHAILKRTQARGAGNEVFRLEGLSIDFAARTVSIDGNRITLSPKEYDLLVYLVRNAGVALTREQLLSTGDMISMGMTAHWIRMSSCCVRTLETMQSILLRSEG